MWSDNALTFDELSRLRSAGLIALFFVIIVGCIVLSIGICCLVKHFRDKRAIRKKAEEQEKRERVWSESQYVKAIVELYAKYHQLFHWNVFEMNDCVSCSSRAQAENYGEDKLQKRIIDYAEKHEGEIVRYINQINDNRRITKQYELDCLALPSQSFSGELGEIERQFGKQFTLQPPCEFFLVIDVTYTSPAGRSSCHRRFTISSEQLLSALMQAQKRGTEAERRKKERAKVTPKLRYQVLQRDHFRCVRCGASASDGVRLHVDHIIPISRGGKTEMRNLQTLCETCNLGKGNSIYTESI